MTVESHREWAGCAPGDLTTPIYPCYLFPAPAALNSQQCFFASVIEPSRVPDPLTYSSGHVCTNPPCQFIPAFTFPHGNLIYSPSMVPLCSPSPLLQTQLVHQFKLCVIRGRCLGEVWILFEPSCKGSMFSVFLQWFSSGTGEILGQQRLSLWTPTIPPGAAELIWPRT